jgi:uncharacterized protein with HEPN domain
MQLGERDKGYLWDMCENALVVYRLAENRSSEEFAPGSILRLAIERGVEIIGEAARRVSPECRAADAEIPWRALIAQRNILGHEYGQIDDALLWRAATEYSPGLVEVIDALLPP